MMLALSATPGGAQGLNLPGGIPNIPGLSGQAETPEQKRAFCGRVASAAARCGMAGGLSLDMVAITTCMVRSLPPQDSLRVAQVANSARGNAGAVLSECGVGLR